MRHPGRSDGLERVTIEEVAVAAGVSTATVSRCLTRPERVSDQLAARVRVAVAELGYVPNAAARALSSLRTRLVGVLVAALDSHAQLAAALAEALAGAGRGMLLLQARTPAGAAQAVAMLADRDVEAVLTVGVELPPATRALIAARSIRCIEGEVAAGAAETLAKVLWSVGHRHAAVAGGGGYARAVRTAWEAGGGTLVTAPVRCDEMRAWIGRRREEGGLPTVLACESDELAAAALHGCGRLGLPVPGALSVVGFGDRPLGAWTSPPLATVRLPVAAIAASLVTTLLGSGASRAVPVPKVVVRRSLGPAPGST